jgi:hypothetical protein
MSEDFMEKFGTKGNRAARLDGPPLKFQGTLLSPKHNQQAAEILCALAQLDGFAGNSDRPLGLIIGVNPGGIDTAVKINRMFQKPFGTINTIRRENGETEITDTSLPDEKPKGILVVDAKWKHGNTVRAVHAKLKKEYGQQVKIHYAVVLGYGQKWKSINKAFELSYGMHPNDKVTVYVAYHTDIDSRNFDPIVEELRLYEFSEEERLFYRRRFENQHPRGQLALRFLEQAGFFPTWWHVDSEGFIGDIFLQPLKSEYQGAYGLESNIFVRCFYRDNVEYRDIQHAVIRAQEAEIGHLLHRDVLFVVLKSATNLRDALYRMLERPDQNMTVVPLEEADLQQGLDTNECEAILRQILDQWLYRRDLYQGNVPVSGRRFFGREAELANLIRNFDSGDHTGLFGLRKVGKTSLLYQLREKRPKDLSAYVDPEGAPPGVRDCKYLYWSAANQWREQLEEKYAELADSLSFRLAGQYRSYAELPEISRVAVDFDSDLRLLREILMRREETQPVKALLLLDELEKILPQPGEAAGWEGYADFFTYLRGVAQETGFLVSVVAGANPRICEEAQFEGQDNPVFQFYQQMYLPPLERHECFEMIEKLGKGMGMTYKPRALASIYEETGGHPFITRRLCSRLAACYPARPLTVNQRHIEVAIKEFLLQDEAIFREIMKRLERDFPSEKRLLETIAVSKVALQEQFATQVSRERDEALRHLLGYQLVERHNDTYRVKIRLLDRWLQRWLGERS